MIAGGAVTYYFRRSFTVVDVSRFAGLQMGIVRDDGAVVYVNGVEVHRSNLPTGNLLPSTRATANVAGTAEGLWTEFDLPVSLLTNGRNTIAVEVHQNSLASTDLSFDLRLTAS